MWLNRYRNLDAVRVLVALAADFESRDAEGNTAFLLACKHYSMPILRVLISTEYYIGLSRLKNFLSRESPTHLAMEI